MTPDSPTEIEPLKARDRMPDLLSLTDYPARLLAAEKRVGELEAALIKISRGPNMAPHEEPWSKAEAMIGLDRAARAALANGDEAK